MPTDAQKGFLNEQVQVSKMIKDRALHSSIHLVGIPIWNDGSGELPSDSDERVVELQSGKGRRTFSYYKWELDTKASRVDIEQRIQAALVGL